MGLFEMRPEGEPKIDEVNGATRELICSRTMPLPEIVCRARYEVEPGAPFRSRTAEANPGAGGLDAPIIFGVRDSVLCRCGTIPHKPPT